MTLYEHEGRTYAVIDGVLFLRLDSLGGSPRDGGTEAGDEPQPKRRGRKPKTEAVTPRRRGRPPKAQVTLDDLDDLRGSPPLNRPQHDYQCKRAHRFQSNLPQQMAKCPTCGEKVFREIKEVPVEEGSILGKYESN